jgi:fatty acid desaturase
VKLHTTSSYAARLRPLLRNQVFRPAPLRLLWLPVHYAVILLGALVTARGWLPWPAQLALSLLIGASFAGLTFVAHEALHGSIVRSRRGRRVIGALGFLPFCVPTRLWESWHNRVHHGHTNQPGLDPDAYPTLAEYQGSRSVRRVTDWVAPGRKRAGGAFSLLVGFSVQSSHMLLTAARRGFLSRAQHRLALFEAGLSWAVWIAFAIVVGPSAFVLAFGLPLLVGNAIIMSFILTNHSLSPHTAVNDPLANSLSLTLPRFFDWLTLGFGLHVEHHLFPALSGRHARELSAEVRRLWPDRYQCMPYFKALRLLHHSPRVYRTSTLLFDPRRGSVWPALLPRDIEPSPHPAQSAAASIPQSPAPSRPSPANLLAVSLAASVACSAPALRTPAASEPPPAPNASTLPVATRAATEPAPNKQPATEKSWDPHQSPPATSMPVSGVAPEAPRAPAK